MTKSIGFFCVLTIFLLSTAECMTYDHKLTLKENVCELSYSHNASSDTFHFKLKVYSTGWISLALTLEKGALAMKNYDIALGGMKNSSLYLNDYWSAGLGRPTLDTKQDFTLVSGSESNGWTTLEFYRKADTQDANNQDIKIEKGTAVYFAWARGNDDVASPTSYSKHGDAASNGRGYSKVGYDLFTGKEITPPSASSYLVSSAVLVTLAVVFQYFV